MKLKQITALPASRGREAKAGTGSVQPPRTHFTVMVIEPDSTFERKNGSPGLASLPLSRIRFFHKGEDQLKIMLPQKFYLS